jgi:hypothetical protein
MRTLIAVIVAVVLVGSSVRAEQAKGPTAVARERADALKADLPRVQVWLRYHGEQDKPYYHLTLTTAEVRDGAPFHLRARLTDAQAGRLIDHLALEGFLDRATDESKKDVVPPKGPLYALKVIGGGKEWTEYLRFNPEMLRRLDGLREATEGDAARHLDTLLARLAGHRREWEKQEK